MSCGASIATRAGLHLPCILDENHEGDCVPLLPREASSASWPRGVAGQLVSHWATASEAAFIGHLLAVVEGAGDTLTFVEAVNISRALLRARVGRAPF